MSRTGRPSVARRWQRAHRRAGSVPRAVGGEPGAGLVTRRVQEQTSSFDEDDPRGQRKGPVDALLREYDRAAETLRGGEEALGSVGVELGGRLVQQDELRTHREGRCQAHALKLPAGQLEGETVTQVKRVDGRECLVHPRPDLRGRGAEVLEAEGNFVRDASHHDLVLGILKDRCDQAGQLRGPRRPGVEARHCDPPGEGAAVEMRHEPSQSSEESRLPRARRPEDRDHLSGLDLERHIVERRPAATGIGERQVLDAGDHSHRAPAKIRKAPPARATRSHDVQGAPGARVRVCRPKPRASIASARLTARSSEPATSGERSLACPRAPETATPRPRTASDNPPASRSSDGTRRVASATAKAERGANPAAATRRSWSTRRA